MRGRIAMFSLITLTLGGARECSRTGARRPLRRLWNRPTAMVVTAQHLASDAGAAILRQGGKMPSTRRLPSVYAPRRDASLLRQPRRRRLS